MSSDADEQVEQIVQTVLTSPRYRHLHTGAVRTIAAQEVSKYRTLAEATKATKSKLHQVSGAYFDRKVDYTAWLETLRAAREAGDSGRIRTICADTMLAHASTRERLIIIGAFYRETLG